MKQLLIFGYILLVISCTNTKQDAVDQLFEIDRKFSEAAIKDGFNKAFIDYAHADAVLLRDNSMPVVGKQSISTLYKNMDTTGIRFFWEPINGDIAKSGEMGYTYGIYTFQKDSLIEKGTYTSIWKKDTKGEWKYVLDTGNEGLGE